MRDGGGEILYVGKAKNLKKRLTSYFRRTGIGPKTAAMVGQVRAIELAITHTENEALILESNLIKELHPRYNVLLRDDKSYPYIYLSDREDFPRLALHRGAKRIPGQYFGPYPSAGAIRESLHLLKRLFRVRQCENSYFRNRSRPCLQYQIKRCSAPCVGLISKATYAEDVRHAVMFLEGKSSQVIDELVRRMEAASARLDYELAARYRDQIAALRRAQEKQYVSSGDRDLDVIAGVVRGGASCVQVFSIRHGTNLGNKTYFPRQPLDSDAADMLNAFLPQYYLNRQPPAEILVNQELPDRRLLQEMLTGLAKRRVVISHNVRGERTRWLQMAATNAEHALAQHLSSKANMLRRFEALQDALHLDDMPQRLECFDVSHTGGEAAVASCVVFDPNGPLKSDYRRFNISGLTPGDDYAALGQALARRYRRLIEGEGKLPDILFIDGGKGQVRRAVAALRELQLDELLIIGIAKGPERKPGRETLHLSGHGAGFILPDDSPALHLIQQIRDEAHRFAITGHRQRRAKSRNTSMLETIAGLGPKRRQQLLKQFGGLHEVARAGVDDLARVHGISRQLAQRIYDAFHLVEGHP